MKKLLALVLALVMTMSLCTISNAAYSDAADVNYDEAVDVMSAVGVFQGANGKFSPKENLTREQAAKLIAYLDLGEKTAEALPELQVFSDVAASRWSSKYIAYCADAGYINGVGDGKFDPTGALTGYAFGKMLLCVLGYDATIEGYTGANWTIAVAKQMAKDGYKLAEDVELAPAATLTRESAAMYCFNAIQMKEVDYESKGTNIEINGATIATGASKAEAIDTTLMADLYDTDLKCKSGKDAYNRAANEWWYDGDYVGSYATDTADYTFVIDSKDYDTLEELVDEKDIDIDSYGNYSKSVGLPIGCVVELYVDDDDTLTAMNAYFYAVVQIEGVEKTEDEDAIAAGATYEIELESNTADIDKVYDINVANFDAATYVEDAYVMLPMVDTDDVACIYHDFDAKNDAVEDYIIVDTKVVTPVKGDVTTVKTDEYVTMNGTKYILSSFVTGDTATAGDTFSLFVDANGIVVRVEEVEEADATIDEVYYVAYTWADTKTSYSKTEYQYYAQLVALDGTTKEVELEEYPFATSSDAGDQLDDLTINGFAQGALVTISDKKVVVAKETVCKASNQKYNLKVWSNGDFDVYSDTIPELEKADTRMSFDGKTIRLNASTKYIFIEGVADDLDVDVYTGGVAYANGGAAYVITEDDSSVAKYVIVSTTDAEQVTEYSEDVVFIKKLGTEKGDGYVMQDVYLKDGSKETWKVDDAEEYSKFNFYTYATNDDGYYEFEVADAMAVLTDTWDDEEGVLTSVVFVDLYENLLTVADGEGNTYEDIKAGSAKFVDLHDTDDDMQYNKSITSLEKIDDLVDDDKIAQAVLALNVSDDGVVTVFLLGAYIGG